MTDKDLCLRLRNGSRSALNETITRFTPYVGAVAWRVMCPIATREDLEEVVADTFIILWNHRLEIDATSIRAWLAKVAKNKAIDKMRAMKLMEPLSDEEAYGTSNVDPEARMIQLDRYTRLWDAVNSLEEPDRNYIDDFTLIFPPRLSAEVVLACQCGIPFSGGGILAGKAGCTALGIV